MDQGIRSSRIMNQTDWRRRYYENLAAGTIAATRKPGLPNPVPQRSLADRLGAKANESKKKKKAAAVEAKKRAKPAAESVAAAKRAVIANADEAQPNLASKLGMQPLPKKKENKVAKAEKAAVKRAAEAKGVAEKKRDGGSKGTKNLASQFGVDVKPKAEKPKAKPKADKPKEPVTVSADEEPKPQAATLPQIAPPTEAEAPKAEAEEPKEEPKATEEPKEEPKPTEGKPADTTANLFEGMGNDKTESS